jgi:hypothetical protein
MYQGHYSRAMGFQERVIAPYGKASPQKSYKGLREAVPPWRYNFTSTRLLQIH